MASYLLTFPTAHDGGDVVRILDAMDTLAEADRKGRLSIRYSDITSAFYRTIVEFSDDDILVDDFRKAGWTIEPAPAGGSVRAAGVCEHHAQGVQAAALAADEDRCSGGARRGEASRR